MIDILQTDKGIVIFLRHLLPELSVMTAWKGIYVFGKLFFE